MVGRSLAHLRETFSMYEPLVEYVEANLADGRAAFQAAQGVETIYYALGLPLWEFEAHPQLTRTSLEAAQSAGVRRFLHVGNVWSFGYPQSTPVSESHPRDPHTYKGRMRKKQEDLVLAADGQRGLRTTILRAPDFYGPTVEHGITATIIRAALKGKPALLLGPVAPPHEFVYVPDLAKTLMALVDCPQAYGQALNLAGPETISYRRFAELAYAAVNRRPRLRVLGKTHLRLIGLFDRTLREVVELHYLWTRPILLDDHRLRKLLPELQKTPYDVGIRATLEALRHAPKAES